MSLFQEIRDASRAVAERADFVRIDEAALKKYALTLPEAEMAAPKLDPSRHFLDRGADTAAFIVTLDTINFGSGWFPHLKKRPGLSGYFTIASALNDLFRAEGAADSVATGASEWRRVRAHFRTRSRQRHRL